MIAENPRLPGWGPGGHPMNPLGVRALYLGDSTYRIHGTDAPWTISTAIFKGCIRMYRMCWIFVRAHQLRCHGYAPNCAERLERAHGTKTKKSGTEPHRAAKSKRRSIPLVAENAAARKSKPIGKRATPVPLLAAAATLVPALAMFEFMQRATSTYAELPSRLIQCRSPMDVWREQARFARRILSITEMPASALSGARLKRTRKAS